MVGIALGLVIGKPLGILAGARLATALGLASLPRGVGWRGVGVVGLVAGIGFTMSLFVAELAFEGSRLDAAKLGIVIASAVAGVLGLAFGVAALRPGRPGAQADSPTSAESSTED